MSIVFIASIISFSDGLWSFSYCVVSIGAAMEVTVWWLILYYGNSYSTVYDIYYSNFILCFIICLISLAY